MKKLILFLLLIAASLSFTSCFWDTWGTNQIENVFEDWEEGGLGNVGIYDSSKNVISLENSEFDQKLLQEKLRNFDYNLEFYVEKNGILYGVTTDSKYYLEPDSGYDYCARIYSVDIQSQEITFLYEESFEPTDRSQYYEYLEGTYCYYKDRCIVLYDGCKAVYFNIDDLTAETVDAKDYIPYEPQYRVETIINQGENYPEKDPYDFEYDRKKVMIVKGNEKNVFSIEDMAEKNEYVGRLLQLPYSSGIVGGDPLQSFFNTYNSAYIHTTKGIVNEDKLYNGYVYDDIIYFYCTVYDKDADRNHLIFSYNPEEGNVKFMFRWFTMKEISPHIFPRVK